MIFVDKPHRKSRCNKCCFSTDIVQCLYFSPMPANDIFCTIEEVFLFIVAWKVYHQGCLWCFMQTQPVLRLDMSWASIIHSSQKLWLFEFAESFRVQFRGSRYMMYVNRTSERKVIAIWITQELPLFNFVRLDINGRRSYIRVKSYDRLNLPRASVFNFEGVDIWCTWIGYPSEMWNSDTGDRCRTGCHDITLQNMQIVFN